MKKKQYMNPPDMSDLYEKLEKLTVEPIDCEECAFNSGVMTALDAVKEYFNQLYDWGE